MGETLSLSFFHPLFKLCVDHLNHYLYGLCRPLNKLSYLLIGFGWFVGWLIGLLHMNKGGGRKERK
jgi:hypothetical protein